MASLRKARGKYYARLYYSNDGKNKEKIFPLNTQYRREAESRLLEVNQYRDLALNGEFIPSWKSQDGNPREDGYRISEAKKDFLKSRKADGIRESTLKMYQLGFKRFIMAVSDKAVKDITIKDIDLFKAFYMDTLNPVTINMGLRQIKTFLYWLKDRDHIDKVPRIKQINIGCPLPIYLTNVEFKEICKRVDPHFARAFWLYRETGLRLSEPFKGEINGSFLTITADTAKGRKDHDTYLTPDLKVVILEMRSMVNEKVKLNIAVRENAIHLYTETFYKACRGDKRKGIEPIKNRKFHSLRHATAVRTYLKTRDIYEVMRKLNHGSVKTTEIYTKYDIKRLAQDFPDLIHKDSETPKKQDEKRKSDTDLRTQTYHTFA